MRSKRAHAPHILSAGTSIEVRCHLNCPWSPGFEVEEAVLVEDEVSYRIRRAESGWALPTAFGADYVRRLGRRSPALEAGPRGNSQIPDPATYGISQDFAVSRRSGLGRRGRRELERPST